MRGDIAVDFLKIHFCGTEHKVYLKFVLHLNTQNLMTHIRTI